MVDRPKGRIAPWMAERMRMPPGSVLGTTDVARLLGVTRQRVSQLKKDPTFPRPGIGYGRVGLWHRAGIQCWAAAHRPGRPEAGGRFGEIGPLLLAAEARSARAGVHWVDTGAFWLAVAEGEAGEALARATISMGITAEEIKKVVESMRPSDERPKRSLRMTPRLQEFLASADRAVGTEGRDRVRVIDVLLSFIDARPVERTRARRQPADHLLAAMSFQGLHIQELRRRLVAADADPGAVYSFDMRRLRRPRAKSIKRPDWLALAPNPLGHDPWTRKPWGAAFAVTRDGRHLEVDGEYWFFKVDGDGFFVRAADGRPVGYRYRVLTKRPKRSPKPVNGFMEILPMPPVEMADWPDRRLGGDD